MNKTVQNRFLRLGQGERDLLFTAIAKERRVGDKRKDDIILERIIIR